MTFFPPRSASAPTATAREHYHSAVEAKISFWASSLRSALVSQYDARPHPFASFLSEATRTAPNSGANADSSNAELERWDLLSALGETCDGPPTAVQLALLDHLAPADTPRLTH